VVGFATENIEVDNKDGKSTNQIGVICVRQLASWEVCLP